MSISVKVLVFLIIGGAVTIIFRELPFLIFTGKSVPKTVTYLGNVLPMAVMIILVIYCIRDTAFTAAASFVPQLAALAVTAGIHIWKRKTSLSIILGTAVYMILIRIL